MEYDISPEVLKLRSYQYRNRRANETLRQMNSKTGIIVEGSVKRALMSQGFTFDDQADNKSEYRPQSCFDNLAKYAGEKYVEFDQHAWDMAYAATLKAFSLEVQLKQEKDVRVLAMYVKGEKASGAPEFGKKQDTLGQDLVRMDKWLKGEIAPYPCIAQHRVQHGKDGQSKNRLVWAYPQAMTLAEAMFARPLIDAFVPRRSVMAMGKHRHKLAAMMTPMLNSHAVYGLDVSAFDSSAVIKLIHMAFNVLAHNFDWACSSRDDWEKIEHYFIHTPILMPDGWVYTKHRGVPSGSYFTQLVDSVINFFIIQYAWVILTGKTIYLDRILVLGDDSLFSSNLAVSLQMIAKALQAIGFKMNETKSCLVIDQQGDIEFLGHRWHYGLVDRRPEDIVKRMVYPERHSKEKDARTRIRTRIYPYLNDAISAHNIISDYQRAKSPDILARYSSIEINLQESLTGWKEHLNSINEEPRGNNDVAIQAYLGVLR